MILSKNNRLVGSAMEKSNLLLCLTIDDEALRHP